MRKFLRFWEILIVGLLLTAFALLVSVTDLVLNEKTVKKILTESNIYSTVNEKLQKEIKDEVKDEFAKYPEVRDKMDDMIEHTITVDVLESETDDILKQLYSNSGTIELDAGVLIDRYTNNLKKYLSDNNIELPAEVDHAIEEVKAEAAREGKVDILKNDEDNEVKESLQVFYKSKDMVILGRNILAAVIIGIVVFAVLVSTEKLKVIYKPLIFSGLLLMAMRLVLTRLLEEVKWNDIEGTEARDLVITIKNTVLYNLDTFVRVFLISGLALMITKIVLSLKKDKRQRMSDELNETKDIDNINEMKSDSNNSKYLL